MFLLSILQTFVYFFAQNFVFSKTHHIFAPITPIILKMNSMNKEQLAETLNGRYYGDEITKEEQQQAKENGLVVVFGASDDLMEFRGALYDEYSCYDGGSVLFTSGGQEVDEDDLEVLKKYEVDKSFNKIEAVWGEGYDTGEGDEPCSWQYKTDIPHSTFRVIEDNELYCVGIVFHISSLV